MGLNWYLQLRNLSKTDVKAAELFQQLQTAGTDDEKENAKQQAQEYIQTLQSKEVTTEKTEDVVLPETKNVVEQDDRESSDVVNDSPVAEGAEITEEKKPLSDLSALAFNPRLAKCGITREEELFLLSLIHI